MIDREYKNIGPNIRYLRQEKEFTIAELASLINIKAVPLGRIERSENIPSTNVLYKLSKEFNISMDAFFSETLEELKSFQLKSTNNPIQIFDHKSLNKLPSSVKDMVIETIQAIQDLEKICGIQKHSNIPLLIPFDPDKNGIETLSMKVRRYMDIGESIVFDYFELFESNGLRVISCKLPKDIHSFSYYDHVNQNAFFFIDSKITPERQIFRLIHEFGKILISTYSIHKGKDLFENGKMYHGKPFDNIRAANLFAANFLVPINSLKKLVDHLNIGDDQWSYDLLLRLKNRYGISAQALLRRLNHLHFINIDVYYNCLKELNLFYEKTDYKEPGFQKRIITHNGRLADLLLIGENIDKNKIMDIKKTFEKWRLPL